MLIRITQSNPGCSFAPGQLIRVGDTKGEQIIEQGYGEQADESEVQKFDTPGAGIPRVANPRGRGNAFMLPPRFLHGCGYVAKSAEELEEHARDCE